MGSAACGRLIQCGGNPRSNLLFSHGNSIVDDADDSRRLAVSRALVLSHGGAAPRERHWPMRWGIEGTRGSNRRIYRYDHPHHPRRGKTLLPARNVGAEVVVAADSTAPPAILLR